MDAMLLGAVLGGVVKGDTTVARSLRLASRGRFGRARGQSGQVIILVVILAVVLLLAGLLVYNVGRVNLVKTRLQSTADSAAYSSAVVVARAYNFTAYTNRAMVANQVAIAQMVSLASWSRYYCLVFAEAECGSFQANFTDPLIEFGLELFEPGQPGMATNEIYQSGSKVIFDVLNGATGPMVTLLDKLELVLSDASQGYLAGSLVQVPLTASEVVAANDPKASISVAGVASMAVSEAQLYGFTKQYKPLNNEDDPNNRFHNVVMASLDKWTRTRGGPEIPPFTSLMTAAGDCFGDGFGGIIFTGGWGGGTSLNGVNTQWTAHDNGAYVGVGVCVIMVPTPIGPIPVPIPIIIPAPGPLEGEGIAGSGGKFKVGTYSGLRPYMGLSKISNNQPDWESPTITLFVERPTDSIDTTAQMHAQGKPIAGGSLATTDSEAGGMLQVSASSEAYFVRPDGHWTLGDGNDQHLVYGNLFNPYWEPHLVETPLVNLAAAVGVQAGP
jgi:hypothetical protein